MRAQELLRPTATWHGGVVSRYISASARELGWYAALMGGIIEGILKSCQFVSVCAGAWVNVSDDMVMVTKMCGDGDEDV